MINTNGLDGLGFMSEARVLVIDGNFTYRIALKQTVLSFGAHQENVGAVRNLASAREIIQEFNPMIVISDLQLEDGIATDLLRDQNWKAVLILLCSDSSPEKIANAKSLGVEQFIYKPCSQTQIGDALKMVESKCKWTAH